MDRLALIAALLASAAGSAAAEGPGTARIAVASDLHYLAPALHDSGPRYATLLEGGDCKNLAQVENLAACLAWSLAEGADRPDCLVITGDLTLNGERGSHLALAALLRALLASGTRVLVLPGNHDLSNPYARRFEGELALATESVGPEDFAAIWADFGYAEALDRDLGSLSYVARAAPGLRILMLDTTESERNGELGYPVCGGSVSDETRAWIGRAAARASAAGERLIAAMHHSLVDHNSVVNQGYTVEGAEELAELLAGLGVGLVLSGHTHVQDIAEAATPSGKIVDLSSGSLAVYPHLVGSLELGADGSIGYSKASLDVASWASSERPGDPGLADFAAKAESFFLERSAGMFSSLIEGSDAGGALSARERMELAALLARRNARFFSGEDFEAAADPEAARAESLVSRLDAGFLEAYARSIAEDETPLAWPMAGK